MKKTLIIGGLIAMIIGCVLTFRIKTSDGLDIIVMMPNTGTGASIAKYLNIGVDMFCKDNPEARIRIVDSCTDPAKAVTAFRQEMLKKKADVVVTVLSPIGSAIIPVANEFGAFVIATAAVTVSPGECTNFVRFNPSSSDVVSPIADYVKSKYKNVVVFHPTDEFGISCASIFNKGIDGSTKSIDIPYGLKDNDVRPLVRKAIESKPEAIFVIGYGTTYINIFKGLKEHGFNGEVLAEYGVTNPDVIQALDKLFAEVTFSGFDIDKTCPETEEARQFVKRVKQDGATPYIGIVLMYTSLELATHLEKTGSLTQDEVVKIGEWSAFGVKSLLHKKGDSSYPLTVIRHDRY